VDPEAKRASRRHRNSNVCTSLEPANLRVCNVFLDLDAPYYPQYLGGIGLKIMKRKNNAKRRGIMTRIPPGPFAVRLSKWIAKEELALHPRCTHEAALGARCR
jgi:hypothetical protein